MPGETRPARWGSHCGNCLLNWDDHSVTYICLSTKFIRHPEERISSTLYVSVSIIRHKPKAILIILLTESLTKSADYNQRRWRFNIIYCSNCVNQYSFDFGVLSHTDTHTHTHTQYYFMRKKETTKYNWQMKL